MPRSPLRLPRAVLLVPFAALALVALSACGGSSSPKPAATAPNGVAPTTTSVVDSPENALVGKPQTRTGIGDVDAALDRYGESRKEMIDLMQAQPWYKDGLTDDEK